jgi:hypothetical protein
MLAKYIEEKDPEDGIIEGEGKVIRSIQETGDMIIHFEDGSYSEMNTEVIYNHINQEYKCEEGEDLKSPNYSRDAGKLYIT